jgi:DNA-binding NarL/FixJ family response regulator
MAISILVADDDEIIRVGFQHLLSGTEINIEGTATTGEELIEKCSVRKFDVVMVDVRLGSLDGFTAIQRLQADGNHFPVIFFSALDNPNYLARSLALGAVGFMLKSETRERWIEAISKAASGTSTWNREELRKMTGAVSVARQAPSLDIPLTQRETDVVRLLAAGMTNREISDALKISYETVKEHVQNILRKVGVIDRTQAAVWAVRKRIV